MVEDLNKYFNWGRYTALLGALIVLIFFSNCYPQNSSGVNNPFNNAFVFGLDGGVTLPQTDYKQSKTGYSFRGVGEYYFNTNSIHLVGLKLKLASEQIKGEDDRGNIPSQDGQRNIPPTFTTNIFSVGLAATYSLSIGDFFFPYLSAGVSNLWFDPKDDQGKPAEYNAANKYSKTTYAFNFEFGLRFLVSDKVSLNVSVNPSLPGTDYLDDVAAASNKDTYSSVLIGFSYSPFSSSDADGDGIADATDRCPDTPAGIKVDEFGCPVDSDNDGVPDYLDKCPDTPKGIAVDQNGCPLDSDGDGIADAVDKCPDTPAGIKVDEFGCPVDTDNDGVPDYLDKCPDTPKGTMVDQKGCPVSETNLNKFLLAADDIFAPNSAMIKVEGKKYLDEVIAQLQKSPDKRWRIEGHMDSNGSKRYLRNLSLDRAKAVLEYFTYFGGLKRENFQVFGMGDNVPVESNDTEEGRSKNRRIEIIPEEVNDSSGSTNLKKEEEFNQFILRGDDTFESNSAILKEQTNILLNEIALYIKSQPDSKWKIEGYMDNQGSASLLKKLSYNRANAVYEYFISEGLSPDQFTVSGLGIANPISTNDTEVGRSTNRRVLIIRED